MRTRGLRSQVKALRQTLAGLTAGGVPPFADWLPLVSPSWRWDWRHLAHIRAQLDRVTAGEIRRLMLFVPPQHGKSSLATVRYPAWRLEREPALRVAIAAYNQRHANRFSRLARRICRERLALSDERAAVNEWETAAGGCMLAVGVGAGITGNPVDLLIIDDPVKSREEAESEAYRERVWGWYVDDLCTRLQPGAPVVLIMTRWHMDDLAGRILDSQDGGNWTVVNLPAEAEDNDPLGRAPGEPLCPERFDAKELAWRRQVLGNSYFALYQQRPIPREGAMFKRAWFSRIIPSRPAGASALRYWDKSGSAASGDFTAGVLMVRDDEGFFTVADVVRGQWSSHERNQIMRQTAELDGPEVAVWVEQEPGSGGKESAEISVRELAGFAVHIERVTGAKQTRALPFAAQCEAGNVRLVRGPWVAAFIDELTSFPAGKFDDQVDAASGAFNKLTLAAVEPWEVIEDADNRSMIDSAPPGVFLDGHPW
jgi:predicted phage terminase large subunit-like protein